MTTNRNITLVLGVLLLLASTAVVSYADGEGGTTPPGDGIAQIDAIQSEALEAMAILDEPRSGGDDLAEGIADDIDSHPLFGMNPEFSRLAIGNLSNSVYVVPADGHVCAVLTVGDGANFNCPPTSAIADGNSAPSTVLLETGDIAVYGVVPDGVESVTVERGESDSAQLEVAENAYYAVVEAGTVLREVTYTGPSGVAAFPIYDPSLPEVSPED